MTCRVSPMIILIDSFYWDSSNIFTFKVDLFWTYPEKAASGYYIIIRIALMDITKPKPGSLRIILDTLGSLVFGGWLFGGIAAVLLSKPDPNAPSCAGPGLFDYGCMGGRD